MRLEPLGNLFTLLGLLTLAADRRRPRSIMLAAAGFAFGAAASSKIWWLAPLAVVVVWQLVQDRSLRRVWWLAGGAVVSFLLIDGPFFLAAPRKMLHMVVLDQLGRPRRSSGIASRLADLSGVTTVWTQGGATEIVLALAMLALVITACCFAWQISAAELMAVLTAFQVLILLVGPSFAFYYGDFAAVPFCLTGAAAVAALLRHARKTTTRLSRPVCAALVCLPLAVVTAGTTFLLANRVARGCRNWVDVSGTTYGVDKPPVVRGHRVSRKGNQKWQRALRRYLTSGEAIILVRAATGINANTLSIVTSGGVLATEGGHTRYRTLHRKHRTHVTPPEVR